MAIAEVFRVSPAIELMIANDDPIPNIQRQARSEGMRLLSECVLDAVRVGDTTLEEAERVIGFADFKLSAPHPRILVVDDDAMIRHLAATVLERAGYEVMHAVNGSEALELTAIGVSVDAIVLDVGLPDIDGREVLRRLRMSQVSQRIPVIILTGNEDESLENALMDEGADDYLRKPIEPGRLLARIRAILRRAER
jgi:CheY-like chemotaxis protein